MLDVDRGIIPCPLFFVSFTLKHQTCQFDAGQKTLQQHEQCINVSQPSNIEMMTIIFEKHLFDIFIHLTFDEFLHNALDKQFNACSRLCMMFVYVVDGK